MTISFKHFGKHLGKHMGFAALMALFLGCTTYGVEFEDHVLTTSSRARDIQTFAVADMPVDGHVAIRGGADVFMGEMRVTGWFAPGEAHDILDYLSLSFERDDRTLMPRARYHAMDVENITVREATFDVLADLDVAVDSPGGDVAVSDVNGQVRVGAVGSVGVARVTGVVEVFSERGDVSAEDIDGPVILDGWSVSVANTGIVDIVADDSVHGDIRDGGVIMVEEGEGEGTDEVAVRVTGTDFESLHIQTGANGTISLALRRSSGWTLDIQAGYAGTSEDEEPGQVSVHVGDIMVDRSGPVDEVFTVGGGGPRIEIRGAGDVFITDD